MHLKTNSAAVVVGGEQELPELFEDNETVSTDDTMSVLTNDNHCWKYGGHGLIVDTFNARNQA